MIWAMNKKVLFIGLNVEMSLWGSFLGTMVTKQLQPLIDCKYLERKKSSTSHYNMKKWAKWKDKVRTRIKWIQV